MRVIAQAEDRYTPFTVAELKALKAAGHDAVVAYLGKHTRNLANGIAPQDLKNYVDAGMHVIFNFEAASNHRTYFTAAQGAEDATDVLTELRWLGVKPDASLTVYHSVDYDAYLQSDFDAVDAYFEAVERVYAGKLGDGVYGGYPVVEYLFSPQAKSKPQNAWQTLAWSGGRISQHACMYQDAVNTWVAHLMVDNDQVFRDPGWYPRPFHQ